MEVTRRSFMARVTLRRIGAGLAGLMGILVVSFALLSTLAPLAVSSSETAGPHALMPEEAARLRALFRLDSPVFFDASAGFPQCVTATRFGDWLQRVLRLDFGESLTIAPGTPITALLRERLPVTLLVVGLAILALFLIGTPLGILCASRRGGVIDTTVQGSVVVLAAAPEPWVGTLFVTFLCSAAWWRLFPLTGLLAPSVRADLSQGTTSWLAPRVWLDAAHHLVLPVALLVQPALAVVVRSVRSAAIGVLGAPFVTSLRARGLSERRILRHHVLRAVVPSVVALVVATLPALITGSLIVETLFGIEGMGDLAWRAASQRDLPVAMAVLVLAALVTIASRIVGDVISGGRGSRGVAS